MIDVLLFDYIISIYPLFLTGFLYVCIELYDRKYRLIVFLSSPMRKCFKIFHTTWDPKRMILNTFATFFLLSYLKLLFVSASSIMLFFMVTYPVSLGEDTVS